MDENQQNQQGSPAPQNAGKQQGNIMSFISYISFLCLVPLLTQNKDETVKFHAKQGLVIFAGEVITWLVVLAFPVLWFLNILWLVLSLMGIMNVYRGEKKEIPLTGKFASKFKI